MTDGRRFAACWLLSVVILSWALPAFGGEVSGGDFEFINARVDPIVDWIVENVARWGFLIGVVFAGITWGMTRGQGGGGMKAVGVGILGGGIAVNAEEIVTAWAGQGALIPFP